MSRELEILEKFMDGDRTKNSILSAMRELARERSIGFARFADENHWRRNRKSDLWFNNEFTFISEDQLYDLYLSQLNK
jgi:hypothetical protein